MASPASQSTSAPVVSIKDVTHRYGSVVALDGISLDIPSGLMVGIIGPDGVGKSTLMAIVAGSKKLQEGNVTVLGGDIADARHRGAVCPQIAICPRDWARTSTWSSAFMRTLTLWQDSSDSQPRSVRPALKSCLMPPDSARFPNVPLASSRAV
ncbi:MAG: ABC transporter ATP-binding component [Candidatus Brocadia fulgida]|uniref:ABC transporter ATP-binding component n=1 Tax=Candidatus Brocadia fulgida TaxID=380242 RepID=A0A0M2UTX9_9BACT|nr:MAG: ABC transporter ATP-binding component [Candidatus Brocadia fulgida]